MDGVGGDRVGGIAGRRTDDDGEASQDRAPTMTRWRRRAVYGLIAVIVAGHLYDVATGGEHWPFSSYPMYSHLNREWTLSFPRLVGIRRDGSELPLWRTEYLAPLDQSRLDQALGGMLSRPDWRTRVGAALADCLARYERRRRAGAHDGPALRALRLYDLGWTLDRAARNVDAPDRRRLLLEVAATRDVDG